MEHRIDRKRVFVTGLSAGGAMASVMLATYPEIFAGGAIIAGLPFGSANTIPEAFDRMRGHGGPSEQELQQLLRAASPHKGPWPSISIWQGSADRTVAPSNADAILGQWRGVHELAKTPSGTEIVDGHTRQVWRGADGRVRIEKHRIAGMGHGTPLATVSPGGLGAAGPFMLDVGISSTRRIARVLGISQNLGWTAQPKVRSLRPVRLPAKTSPPRVCEKSSKTHFERRVCCDRSPAGPPTSIWRHDRIAAMHKKQCCYAASALFPLMQIDLAFPEGGSINSGNSIMNLFSKLREWRLYSETCREAAPVLRQEFGGHGY